MAIKPQPHQTAVNLLNNPIKLAEVQLFDDTGTLMPRNRLRSVTMSTPEYDPCYGGYDGCDDFVAEDCFDGITDTTASECQSESGNIRATLTIEYDCPGTGATTLSMVAVYPTPTHLVKITLYIMEFRNSKGIPDRPTYVFTDGRPLHIALGE